MVHPRGADLHPPDAQARPVEARQGLRLLTVPEDLRRTAALYWGAEGEAWLSTVAERVAVLAERWSIEVGAALPGAGTGYVAAAVLPDGEEAVLKVAFPDRESRWEAAALSAYGGDGAVRLLAHDAEHHALLVERCRPGTPLLEHPSADEVLAIGVGLMARLWRAPPPGSPFEGLGDVCREWADLVEYRFARLAPPFDRRLVSMGADLLRQLPVGTGSVVLHCDFHPGNVLASTREPWLVIDPKPMIGDPAFEPIQFVLQVSGLDELADAPAIDREIARRVAVLAESLSLERLRVASWGVARSVEWALWYVDHGDLDGGRHAMAHAAAFAAVTD